MKQMMLDEARRIGTIALAVLILLLSGAAVKAEDEPSGVLLRASIESDEQIWIGQKVTLQVDVLARDGWAQLKKVHDVEIPGLRALRVETQGTRLSETISGTAYSGQRYEYLLFPQRSGALTVPPVPVDVELKTWGAGAGSRILRMDTPQVQFEVRVPPGAENITGIVSTTALTVEQTWDPEPGDFKVGDAIKRTIVLEAEGLSGMAFTPLAYNRIPGVGIYPGEPSQSDRVERGELLSGKRVETVTYIFKDEGTVSLPSVERVWWDVSNEELKRAELPGVTLQVAPSPVAGETALQERETLEPARSPVWMLLYIVPVAAVIGIAWRFRAQIVARWKTWSRTRRESEPAIFRRFRRAAGSGNAKTTLNALMEWLDRIQEPASVAARLDLFLEKFGDEAARHQSERLLEAALQMESPQLDGRGLVSELSAARKRWLNARNRADKSNQVLPELN